LNQSFLYPIIPYTATLGPTIDQVFYATHRGNEHGEPKKLLGKLNPEGWASGL
jgi:hypothetical protein